MKINFLLLLPLLLLCSCATITRGVHEKLKVESDPTGAMAVLSTGERGVTPAVFVKSRKESFAVTITKPGYKPETVKVESKFSATGGTAMAGNALVGGVIGIGVDAMSGATSSLYPNPVVVHLVPLHGNSSSSTRTTITPKKSSHSTTIKVSPLPKPSP